MYNMTVKIERAEMKLRNKLEDVAIVFARLRKATKPLLNQSGFFSSYIEDKIRLSGMSVVSACHCNLFFFFLPLPPGSEQNFAADSVTRFIHIFHVLDSRHTFFTAAHAGIYIKIDLPLLSSNIEYFFQFFADDLYLQETPLLEKPEGRQFVVSPFNMCEQKLE